MSELSDYEAGDRVYALLSMDDHEARLLGFGEYEGQHLHPDYGIYNPRIRLDDGKTVWTFPPLDRRAETDPSWAATLDTLRAPRKQNQKLAEWRREAPIRPVVFEDMGVLTEDTVHLHLEHRGVQRLLARFPSQGFLPRGLSPPLHPTVAATSPASPASMPSLGSSAAGAGGTLTPRAPAKA